MGFLDDSDDSGAIISDNGIYRYLLWRLWSKQLPTLVVCMLNPSTANAYKNDATIRKCIRFAMLWGFGGIEVVNFAAYRTTSPSKLFAALHAGVDIFGPHNWSYQQRAFAGRVVLCAWGANASRMPHAALLSLKRRLALADKLICLDLSFGGQPLHPLYQPGSSQPKPFVL